MSQRDFSSSKKYCSTWVKFLHPIDQNKTTSLSFKKTLLSSSTVPYTKVMRYLTTCADMKSCFPGVLLPVFIDIYIAKEKTGTPNCHLTDGEVPPDMPGGLHGQEQYLTASWTCWHCLVRHRHHSLCIWFLTQFHVICHYSREVLWHIRILFVSLLVALENNSLNLCFGLVILNSLNFLKQHYSIWRLHSTKN